MPITLTPAEQHIAEQSERRDLTSICQRLARLEDRFAITTRTAGEAHKNAAEAFEHIESVKRSLEGAHESIERLMNRVSPDLPPKIPGSDWKILADEEATKTFTDDQMRRMARVGVLRITRTGRHMWAVNHSDGTTSGWGATMLAEEIVNDIEEIEREARKPGAVHPMPQPDPMPGFELGAKLRRQVDEDMATICGQEPQQRAQWTGAELEQAQKDWARETAAELNRVPPFVRSPQDAYNRRMSEILSRAAADIERASAYYELVDRLERLFAGSTASYRAPLVALWKALGSPQRPGEQPPEGHDRTQEDDYGREG